ncbi:MAG: ATP-binding protein [Bacteriovoracia bacterium]
MQVADKLPINILLVDDRPENLISLEAVLKSPEYNLVQATSGTDALRALLGQDFALILMDVQMPEMDGFQTANLIKQRERSKNIPIIFITAASKDHPFIYKGYEAGAVDYIVKPFEPYILRSKVAVFAELYRKSQEIRRQGELLRQAERKELENTIANLEVQTLRREQAANQKYRDLVEGIHQGIVWTANPASCSFTFVSPQAEGILGVTAADWRDDHEFWSKSIHPDDREKVLTVFHRVRRQGSDEKITHRFVRPDGQVLWLHTTMRLTRGATDHGDELRGLSVDITQLKNTERDLRRAIRFRDEFLSVASHELKTPLTSLKIQLQLAQRNVARQSLTSDTIPSLLTKFDTQIRRLHHLIENLLDVTQLQAGRVRYHLEEVNLAQVVSEVLDRFSEELKLANCQVDGSLDSHLLGMWDRSRIDQIVVNLITNAIKYAPGAPLQIDAYQDGEHAVLEVADGGPGIPARRHKTVFERFARGAAHRRNISGLGLGLFITKQIVESHRGKVELDRGSRGGAKFTVRLPLRTEVPEEEILPVKFKREGDTASSH